MGLNHGGRGPNIVRDGLVLYLDAGSPNSYQGTGTTWKDISKVNQNNGTLVNGPTFSSGNGGSIVFDGVDDYVNCGNASSLNFERTSSFSFCFWIYPTSFLSNGAIASKYDTSDKGWTIGIGVGGEGLISLALRNTLITNDFVVSIASSNSLLINNWYFISITYSGTSNTSGVSFYINGVKTTNNIITRDGLTQNISNTANTLISGRLTNSIYYTGRMFSFTAYNKVLTASEVLQNYNATKGRFGL
jgi:hypothetical protein